LNRGILIQRVLSTVILMVAGIAVTDTHKKII